MRRMARIRRRVRVSVQRGAGLRGTACRAPTNLRRRRHNDTGRACGRTTDAQDGTDAVPRAGDRTSTADRPGTASTVSAVGPCQRENSGCAGWHGFVAACGGQDKHHGSSRYGFDRVRRRAVPAGEQRMRRMARMLCRVRGTGQAPRIVPTRLRPCPP